jgi:hypothetical protein
VYTEGASSYNGAVGDGAADAPASSLRRRGSDGRARVGVSVGGSSVASSSNGDDDDDVLQRNANPGSRGYTLWPWSSENRTTVSESGDEDEGAAEGYRLSRMRDARRAHARGGSGPADDDDDDGDALDNRRGGLGSVRSPPSTLGFKCQCGKAFRGRLALYVASHFATRTQSSA